MGGGGGGVMLCTGLEKQHPQTTNAKKLEEE